jgi:hypothetical protein
MSTLNDLIQQSKLATARLVGLVDYESLLDFCTVVKSLDGTSVQLDRLEHVLKLLEDAHQDLNHLTHSFGLSLMSLREQLEGDLPLLNAMTSCAKSEKLSSLGVSVDLQ